MKVSISGMKGLEKAFSSYKKTKTDELRDATNEAAVNVDRTAKSNTPVDTGRLRSSIHPVFAGTTDGQTGERMGDLEAAVTTNVEYAPFIENGTRNMAAQPFLMPAWESERPEYVKRVKSILKKI